MVPGRETVVRVLARIDSDILDCVVCRFPAETGAAPDAVVPEQVREGRGASTRA